MPYSALNLLSSLVISLGFSGLAFFLRAVTWQGALTGGVVCFFIATGAGWPGLTPLITVFFLASLSTKIGYQQKMMRGTAERVGGRSASQILANLGVAAVCAILFAVLGEAILLLGMAAALAEAAADTVSSELGQLSRERVRLITTWKQVPPGTDGGVTLLGTGCGLAASSAVIIVSVFGGLVPWHGAGIVLSAAFFGTLADSFLGAWLERRNLLNNDMVNFFGTLVAAAIAMAL